MKLFIILINLIIAGSVVQATEELADISPLVRYNGTTEWAEIPVVKAEIDRLFEAATKLKDVISVIKDADAERSLETMDLTSDDEEETIDPARDEEKAVHVVARRKQKEREEWYKSAFANCNHFIKLANILKIALPSKISSLQKQLTNSNGEILNQWAFELLQLTYPAGTPLALQDGYFKFSSVSHSQWSILNGDGTQNMLNGEAYVSLWIEPLCQSAINIKKMLGFQRDPDSFGQYFSIGEE